MSRSSELLDVRALKQDVLRLSGLYWRDHDPLASTEFTYTRFLVPHLAEYQGWAMFCDCDFLFLADVANLIALADDRYAVMCVHHDYRPTETTKMDGCVQTSYPRKNWSSMMLFNCGHPANGALTPDCANSETSAYLQRFKWLDDSLIGAVPETWNWLEGWCSRPATGTPAAIHFTRGGPWFEDWQDVDYAAEWLAERDALCGEAGVYAETVA